MTPDNPQRWRVLVEDLGVGRRAAGTAAASSSGAAAAAAGLANGHGLSNGGQVQGENVGQGLEGRVGGEGAGA